MSKNKIKFSKVIFQSLTYVIFLSRLKSVYSQHSSSNNNLKGCIPKPGHQLETIAFIENGLSKEFLENGRKLIKNIGFLGDAKDEIILNLDGQTRSFGFEVSTSGTLNSDSADDQSLVLKRTNDLNFETEDLQLLPGTQEIVLNPKLNLAQLLSENRQLTFEASVTCSSVNSPSNVVSYAILVLIENSGNYLGQNDNLKLENDDSDSQTTKNQENIMTQTPATLRSRLADLEFISNDIDGILNLQNLNINLESEIVVIRPYNQLQLNVDSCTPIKYCKFFIFTIQTSGTNTGSYNLKVRPAPGQNYKTNVPKKFSEKIHLTIMAYDLRSFSSGVLTVNLRAQSKKMKVPIFEVTYVQAFLQVGAPVGSKVIDKDSNPIVVNSKNPDIDDYFILTQTDRKYFRLNCNYDHLGRESDDYSTTLANYGNLDNEMSKNLVADNDPKSIIPAFCHIETVVPVKQDSVVYIRITNNGLHCPIDQTIDVKLFTPNVFPPVFMYKVYQHDLYLDDYIYDLQKFLQIEARDHDFTKPHLSYSLYSDDQIFLDYFTIERKTGYISVNEKYLSNLKITRKFLKDKLSKFIDSKIVFQGLATDNHPILKLQKTGQCRVELNILPKNNQTKPYFKNLPKNRSVDFKIPYDQNTISLDNFVRNFVGNRENDKLKFVILHSTFRKYFKFEQNEMDSPWFLDLTNYYNKVGQEVSFFNFDVMVFDLYYYRDVLNNARDIKTLRKEILEPSQFMNYTNLVTFNLNITKPEIELSFLSKNYIFNVKEDNYNYDYYLGQIELNEGQFFGDIGKSGDARSNDFQFWIPKKFQEQNKELKFKIIRQLNSKKNVAKIYFQGNLDAEKYLDKNSVVKFKVYYGIRDDLEAQVSCEINIQINDINDSPPSVKLIPSEYIYIEDLLKLKVGQKLLEFTTNDLDENSNLSFKILPKSLAISTEILEFGVNYRDKKERENDNKNYIFVKNYKPKEMMNLNFTLINNQQVYNLEVTDLNTTKNQKTILVPIYFQFIKPLQFMKDYPPDDFVLNLYNKNFREKNQKSELENLFQASLADIDPKNSIDEPIYSIEFDEKDDIFKSVFQINRKTGKVFLVKKNLDSKMRAKLIYGKNFEEDDDEKMQNDQSEAKKQQEPNANIKKVRNLTLTITARKGQSRVKRSVKLIIPKGNFGTNPIDNGPILNTVDLSKITTKIKSTMDSVTNSTNFSFWVLLITGLVFILVLSIIAVRISNRNSTNKNNPNRKSKNLRKSLKRTSTTSNESPLLPINDREPDNNVGFNENHDFDHTMNQTTVESEIQLNNRFEQNISNETTDFCTATLKRNNASAAKAHVNYLNQYGQNPSTHPVGQPINLPPDPSISVSNGSSNTLTYTNPTHTTSTMTTSSTLTPTTIKSNNSKQSNNRHHHHLTKNFISHGHSNPISASSSSGFASQTQLPQKKLTFQIPRENFSQNNHEDVQEWDFESLRNLPPPPPGI